MAADGQPVKVGSMVAYSMESGYHPETLRPAIVTDLCTTDTSGLSRVNLAVFADETDFDTPHVLRYAGVMFRTDGQPNSWNWPV